MVNIPIREAFSNRREAEAARDRLEYGGFQRHRVQLVRIGDQFVVILHTRPEEERDARDLIEKTGWLPDWASRYGREIAEYAPSPRNSLLGLAIAAGAGAALYWAFTRPQGFDWQRLGRQDEHGPEVGRGQSHYFDRDRSGTASTPLTTTTPLSLEGETPTAPRG